MSLRPFPITKNFTRCIESLENLCFEYTCVWHNIRENDTLRDKCEGGLVYEGNATYPVTVGDEGDDNIYNFWNTDIYDGTTIINASLGVLTFLFLIFSYRLYQSEVNSRKSSSSSSLLDAFEGSILTSKDKLSFCYRIGIPILIFINITLFVLSNFSNAAVVTMQLHNKEIDAYPDPIFEFDLAGTIQDMWDAKVYPLAIIIAAFSAAWPYVKLTAFLFCWMCPVRKLQANTRQWILVWLDILGKWSLIDTFVMVLMMVAFSFEMELKDLTVNVYVKPYMGFYTFLIATIMSLILGHVSMLCLECIESGRDNESINKGNFSGAIMNHSWSISQDGGLSYKFTTCGKLFVIILLLISGILIVAAGALQIMEFKFLGLTGLLLEESDPGSSTESLSILDIFEALPESSGMGAIVGIQFIQYSFLFFVVVVPILTVILLIFMWIVPMTTKTLQSLLFILGVGQAWSALEVFSIAIAAALFEISTFAKFLIGDKCDSINEILEEYADDKLDGHDVCFDVNASLETESWTLFTATFLLMTVNTTVFCIVRMAIRERLYGRDVNSGTQKSVDIFPHLDTTPLVPKSSIDSRQGNSVLRRIFYCIGIIKVEQVVSSI